MTQSNSIPNMLEEIFGRNAQVETNTRSTEHGVYLRIARKFNQLQDLLNILNSVWHAYTGEKHIITSNIIADIPTQEMLRAATQSTCRVRLNEDLLTRHPEFLRRLVDVKSALRSTSDPLLQHSYAR